MNNYDSILLQLNPTEKLFESNQVAYCDLMRPKQRPSTLYQGNVLNEHDYCLHFQWLLIKSKIKKI